MERRHHDQPALTAIAGTDWKVAGVADFNGDGEGRHPLAQHHDGHDLLWIMNGATHASPAADHLSSAPTGRWPATGDFNGDGKADILWRNTTDGKTLGLDDGRRPDGQCRDASPRPTRWAVAGVGDFNGDGRADILWRNMTTGKTDVWSMDGATMVSARQVAVLNAAWSVAF